LERWLGFDGGGVLAAYQRSWAASTSFEGRGQATTRLPRTFVP